jgi:hypothetical protein
MATMIVLTSAAMKLVQVTLNHMLGRHIQAWRRR